MKIQNSNGLFRKNFFKVTHFLALFGMLHSTIALPAQGIAEVVVNSFGFYHCDGLYIQMNIDPILNNIVPYSLNENNELINNSFSEPAEKVSNFHILSHENINQNPISYSSDLKEGTIGSTEDIPFDNAYDNIFKVDVKEIPQSSDRVFLTYDLFGVQDQNAVARSINDRPSVGGYIIKKNNKWTHQKEEIDGSWLKNGENRILFSRANKASFSYKVKNLKIEIEKSKKSQGVDQNLVIQTQNTVYSKEGKSFIKGFIRNYNKDARVTVEGVELDVKNGEFEGMIPVSAGTLKYNISIQASDENGLIAQAVIPVNNIIEADNAFPIEKSSISVSRFFKVNTSPSELFADGASIALNTESIAQDVQISITKLRKVDITPLESGMLNVTKDGKAYRFTPDGMKFKTPVEISIEYDTALIPKGYRPEDIKTYFFNTESKRWEVVQTDTIILANRTVISSTTHFTDYINGIVQVPESPQTSAFTSTMMNDIKAADPAANITLISPPEASQTGDANVSYPIKIPAGRKGLQPQLALQYSSEGGDSWIGKGWNLSVPGISIDTKWGVPTFGDINGNGIFNESGENIESEIYTLGNDQLMYPPIINGSDTLDWMPNRHVIKTNNDTTVAVYTRLSPGAAVFTPRKQGSFAKIERLGNSPTTYYWKVTGNDGTISWYGGKTQQNVTDSVAIIKRPDGNIVYWALYMTEDVYGNNVKYTYSSPAYLPIPDDANNANLTGGKMFYLKQICYTGFNGANGNYTVDFVTGTTIKSDVSINARNGFKQIDPYLLQQVDIKYKTALLRSYKLEYKTGKFSKTLLNLISEKDKNGKEFYSHQFEYYDDITQDGVDSYFGTAVTQNICTGKCFTTYFPVPLFTDTVYKYETYDGYGAGALGSYCTYPNSVGKVYSYTINGSTFSPQPSNLFLTHYKNHIETNLCPNYIITNPLPLDPVTENTDFEVDCKSWIYSILSQYSPFDLTVTNKSGLYKNNSYIINENSYFASFYSHSNLLGFTSVMLNTASPGPLYSHSNINKNTFIKSISLPVTIHISTSSSSHTFGPYSLSDPYYVSLFQQQFQEQYPGNTTPLITSTNNQITITIPSTNLQFNSVSVTAGGVTNTYPFTPCNSGTGFGSAGLTKSMSSKDKDWSKAKPSEKERESAIKKLIADGNELDMPIPDAPYDIVIEVSKKQIKESEIGKYQKKNDSLDWSSIYNFDLNGIFILHMNNDSIYWKDSKNNKIDDQRTLNTLEVLLPGDKMQLYTENKLQHQKKVKENRLTEKGNASTDIQKKYKQDWDKFSFKDSTNTSFEKTMFKSKKLYVPYTDNLKDRYTVSYQPVKSLKSAEATDTTCSPIINTDFINTLITPTFNTSAGILGSTSATSKSMGGYLGAGIGWNNTSKRTTFGYQYTHGWTNSEALVAMVDIDGDGLDDLVVRQGDAIYFKKHLVSRTYDSKNLPILSHLYSENKPIQGITNFYLEKGQSSSSNFQASYGVKVVGGFAGIDFSKSKSETSIYFTDANGDGLIDVVNNGVVYFNHIVDGIPTFEATSKRTENMVIKASDKNISTPAEYIQDSIVYPDYDVVKMWEAPASGTIRITNNIELTDLTKQAQVTIELSKSGFTNGFVSQPGPSGKDSYISSFTPSSPNGDINTFTAISWTSGSTPFTGRGLIDFNLTSIPANAIITDARLSLYAINHSGLGFTQYLTPATENTSILKRITASWNEATVTWNTPPSTTPTNQVTLPSTQTTATTLKDFTNINVTQLVQDMVNNKSGSFGFEFNLLNESKYRRVVFASGDYTDSTKRPKLVVSYTYPGLNSTPTSSCGRDPNELCLLFGSVLKNTSPVINNVITNSSTNCSVSAIPLTVTKGDRIYFRVHNVDAGNPPVNWNPKVEYTTPYLNSVLDQNGISPFNSSYSDGFILSGESAIPFPGDGTATISWDPVTVNNLSDNVTFEIIKTRYNLNDGTKLPDTDTIVFTSGTIAAGTTNYTFSSTGLSPITVTGFNANPQISTIFSFRVRTNSNVNWKQIEWKPKMICTVSAPLIGENGTSEATMTTSETKYPVVDYSIYKTFPCSYLYNFVDLTTLGGGPPSKSPSEFTSANVVGKSIIPNIIGIFNSGNNGKLYFVVKGNNTLIGTRIITVTNGSASINNSAAIPINSAITNIEIGYYADDSKLANGNSSLLEKIANTSSVVATIIDGTSSYPIYSGNVNLFQKPSQKFGPMYRQWGQFMYNPDVVTNAKPIGSLPGFLVNELALQVSQAQATQTNNAVVNLESLGLDNLNLGTIAGQNTLESNIGTFKTTNQSLVNNALVVAGPARLWDYTNNNYIEKWIGLHDQCYASALSSCASGLKQSFSGFINPEESTVQNAVLTGAYSISRYATSKGKNISAGISLSPGAVASVGISGTRSLDGKSTTLSDYTDLNGDRYPDIVTQTELQFTNRTGGLFSKSSNLRFSGEIMKALSKSWGAGASGSFAGGGKSTSGTKTSPTRGKMIYEVPNGNSSIGISKNYSSSRDSVSRIWADINGDGLSDLLEKSGNNVTVKLNYGNNDLRTVRTSDWGAFNLSKSNSSNWGGGTGISINSGSIEGGVSKSTNMNNQEFFLQDMNGDGLLDIVFSNLLTNKLDVRINCGNKFDIEKTGFTDFTMRKSAATTTESYNAGFTFAWVTPFLFVAVKFPCISVNGQLAYSTNRTQKSITDYDGDGFPDLLEEVGNNQIKVRYSNIRRTNKLKTVTNPLGGQFTIDYQVAPKDYNNPNSKWVMSQVTVSDNYNLVNDGVDTYTKDFVYENGKYDRREREFYGFETVKTIDYTKNPDGTKGPAYRTSVTKYHNNSYFLNGMVKESYIYKGSDPTKLFSSQRNVYEIKALKNLNTMVNLSKTLPLTFDVGGTEGRRTAIVLLKSSTNKLYELGAAPLITKSEMAYDSIGRIKTFINYGDSAIITTDDYTTTITYCKNAALTAKNITNVPSAITVSIQSGVKRIRATSDINTTTGAIGKIIARIDPSTTTETILQYDQYGNLNYIEYPPNANGQKMFYRYVYDVDNAKYVNTITDAFGYSSSAVYDPKFDVLLETTDLTLNKIQYTYDDFGRVTKIIGPNEVGVGTDPFTLKFEYFPRFADVTGSAYNGCVSAVNFTPVAITKHYDPQLQNAGNSIETYTFVDGLGRPVQVKKDIEINTNPNRQGTPSYTEAMSVSGKTAYDIYGRAIEQFHPYWEAKEQNVPKNLVINNTFVPNSSKTEYDELDRPVKSTDPAGKISTMEYSVSAGLVKTRSVVDQNGSQSVISESYKDASGNVVKTINFNPLGGDVTTNFVYNAIGELMSYKDAENISSSYSYDQLGRKLTFTHPDNGLTTYFYDKASNLVKLQTANLAAASAFVLYDYDYNRLKSETYPVVAGVQNVANTTYTYGAPGTTNNAAGRLIRQTDASGVQVFEYGKMGEMTKNSRTVTAPTPNLPTRTFTTQYTYDSWKRLQTLVYPDGENVIYKYNRGGNISQVTGGLSGTTTLDYDYVKRVDYDYYEQRTYIKYGNNTEMLYDYSPELRRLQTLSVKASNNENLVSNTYAYDNIGNITSLNNTATASLTNGIGGTTNSSYTYDVLNRLITANGNFTGKIPQPAGNDNRANDTLAMAYTPTGGISTKTQLHSKNGTNVPENTYTNTYTLLAGTHKLSKITDQAGVIETYGYDVNGNITSRAKSGVTTNMYWDEANRLRVVANGTQMQHYIYDAGGERVLKARSLTTAVYVNGTLQNSTITMDNYTTYPNGFIVVDPTGVYSKHYYMGSQRIASRVGDGTAAQFQSKAPETAEFSGLKTLQQKDLLYFAAKAGHKIVEYKEYKASNLSDIAAEDNNTKSASAAATISIYYYHPDHLGTNTLLTDMSGNAYQLFLNLPFGETMAEQSSAGYFQSPYKFNGKELDKETGLYYYGARYYDAKASVWLSVDPLGEKHPNMSPYAYCANNPINLIDPDGRDWYTDADGTIQYNKDLNQKNSVWLLKKGQSYAFESNNGQDYYGNSTNYRKDGSIMYSNQTQAYNRMWSQANRKEYGERGKEQFGIIKDEGVLVLPDYNNTYGGVSEDLYNYKLSGENYVDPVTKSTNSFLATIHTHQYKGTLSSLSLRFEGGDEAFAEMTTPGKPLIAMGHDGNIYGTIRSYNENGGILKHYDFHLDKTKEFTRYSILNGADIRPYLKSKTNLFLK